MVFAFIENVAVLVALSFIQRAIIGLRWFGPEARQVLSGLNFGLAAMVVMSLPAFYASDVIFDSRSVVLSVGALVGGPIIGVIAGLVAGMHRLMLGGAGVLVGLVVIVSNTAIGIALHYWTVRRGKMPGFVEFLVSGPH